jgi:hypothetical protein
MSYAGYRYGEVPLPDLAGRPVIDVVAAHAADPTGLADSTVAIQAALDAAPAGAVVHVPAGLYRCDGLLTLTRPDVVLRGEGPDKSRILFTRHEGMQGKAHLTLRGTLQEGTEHLLAADAAPHESTVAVADAEGIAVGADVLLGQGITDVFVAEHGMTGTWQAFNGTWRAFARRRVVAVDRSVTPPVVTLDVPTRYPLKTRDQASLRVVEGYLSEVGVQDLALSSAVGWADAWSNARVHVLALDRVHDAWVKNVTSFPSPLAPTSGPGAGDHLQNGGILVKESACVTVAGCRMERAQNRGGGGCGYLFEILQANEVLTRECTARAGRHNFIQNWGFGTTGCVWLRCTSSDGFAVATSALPALGTIGHSEYHHSLATANLVDSCVVDDGWSAVNRHAWSSGAGLTATQCVFWNVTGSGVLRSRQYGWGYVIGTGPDLAVETSLGGSSAAGSVPEDWREGIDEAATLEPPSLYEDQLDRRTR